MRITPKHLRSKVSIVNSLLKYDDPQWNTVGAIQLYNAYGSTGVVRIVNTSGGVETLMELGTGREADRFLSGMISALRIREEIER